MSTELIHKLKSSGGDYTSMSTWEDDIPTNSDVSGALTASNLLVFSHGGVTGTLTTGDAVTQVSSGATGEIHMAVTGSQILIEVLSGTFNSTNEIHETGQQGTNYVMPSDAGDGVQLTLACYDDWPSGYTGGVDIIDLTTDATHFIKITVPESERHDGTNGSGFFISSTMGNTLTSASDYTVYAYLDVTNKSTTSGTNSCLKIAGAASNSTIDSCIAVCNMSAGTKVAILTFNNVKILNNLVVSGTYDFLVGAYGTHKDVYIANNTISGCTYGIYSDIAQTDGGTLINNVLYGNGTDFIEAGASSWKSESGDNATSKSSISSALGTITNLTSADFNDAANDDFHIPSTSDLYEAGSDLSSVFTTDIDGDTRTLWSIGIDDGVGATSYDASVEFDASFNAANVDSNASSNVTMQEGVTVDKTLTSQSVTFGEMVSAITLNKSITAGISIGAAISEIINLNSLFVNSAETESAIIFDAELDKSISAGAQADSAVTSEAELGESATSNAETEGQIFAYMSNDVTADAGIEIEANVAANVAMSEQAIADANMVTNLLISSAINMLPSAEKILNVNATFNISVSTTSIANATTESTILSVAGLAFSDSANATGDANANSTIQLNAINTASVIGGANIDAGTNFDVQLGATKTVEVIADASIVGYVTLTANSIAEVIIDESLDIRMAIACGIIAEAAVEAGLNINKIINVRIDEEVITAAIITIPDSRMYVIRAENRVVTIAPEDRNIKIPPEDRNIEI